MTIYESVPPPAAGAQSGPSQTAASAIAGLPSERPSASYWLHKPSQLLLGHRSTPDLPATADVVVVGSGITGAFACDALAAAGSPPDASVLLLEAREACFGATGRNGGHCQPMVYSSTPDIAAFELATFRYLQRFVADHGVPCDWRTLPGGGVHGYLDADLFALAEQLVVALRRTRPDLAAQVTVVRADGAMEDDQKGLTLESLRLRGAAGALVQQHAASLWPYQLVVWVLERLVKAAAAAAEAAPSFNLQTNTPVLRVARDGASSSTAPVWLVETARGTVRTRAVLLAMNGYASHLLPPGLADLIVPVRAQVGALVPPAPLTPAPPASPVYLNHSYVFVGHDHDLPGSDRDDYLVQQPLATPTTPAAGGHLIWGGGRQRAVGRGVGEWRDDVVEAPVAHYLRSQLAPILDVGDDPADIRELKADFEWTGIMGFSRDQHPWVGRVPLSADTTPSGLYLSGGYSGHGMTAAAMCGRAVGGMIRRDLGWDAPAASEDTLAVTLDNGESVELPRSYLLTPERIARARAACPPVAEGERAGFTVELRHLLDEMLALPAAAGN